MKAAKFAAPSKLPMSSKDCGIPGRLPYQTRHIVLDVIDLRWFLSWGVKNGRTKRDFPFLALMGEALVVVGQVKREKDHHEYSDSG
jgi:hypothetical protein